MFLSTSNVGTWFPSLAEDDAQSQASECELDELREREEEDGAEDLGAGGEEQPLFGPTPSFMSSAEEG
jgi:hypothetical protein